MFQTGQVRHYVMDPIDRCTGCNNDASAAIFESVPQRISAKEHGQWQRNCSKLPGSQMTKACFDSLWQDNRNPLSRRNTH